MKLNLTIAMLTAMVLITALLRAQPTETAILHINNVATVIRNDGSLFHDGGAGQFNLPGSPALSTMRAAGIWMAGLDAAGNLKGATHRYGENGQADFQPGVLDNDTGAPSGHLKGIYRVTKADILEHIADFGDNGVIDNPNPRVFGWPGSWNAHFADYNDGETLPETTQFLAPFFDYNGDNYYNPDYGEYPLLDLRGCVEVEPFMPIIPDEMLWFAFNDNLLHTESGMQPIQVEIQCTVFGFNCQESPLGNTVFVRYKIINRAIENIDSTYFGLFADFEIGNPSDDFLGSDSGRSLVFGYNGDADDEGGFGTDIPVMAINLLWGPLDTARNEIPLTHVMPVEAGAFSGSAFYNLLSGAYQDGLPAPNNGFLYDGNPTVPGEWSEVSDGNVPGERRVLSSFGPFVLQPGAVNELVAAFTYYREAGNTVGENLALMYEQADQVQALFDSCFDLSAAAPCTANPTASVFRQPEVAMLDVFPNPFGEVLNIDLEGLSSRSVSVQLVSATGQVVWSAPGDGLASGRLSIQQENLPAGLYWVSVTGEDGGRAAAKVVKR